MTALVVDGLSVTIQGRKLLDGFSLQMADGDVVALLGPNGAGKTTLLRCILGLVRSNAGSVTVRGVDCQALSPRHRAGLVAHLAQQPAVDDALTVIEYVASARFRFDESRSVSSKAAEAALARVDARELAERRLGPLSGGERQRVALAALLAQEAAILLLDEPANHLDPARQAQTYALLGELQRCGATMLIVTHDINLVCHLSDPSRVRVMGMQRGQNAFELPYRATQLCDELTALYGVSMRQFLEDGQALIAPATARYP